MQHFIVWCPELGGEEFGGKPVFAKSAGLAAEEWAEFYDELRGKHAIASGEHADVMVRDFRSRALFRFRVCWKMSPSYCAIDISSAA